MRIDRHVYGSIAGYQTLAQSEGVTAADLHALETFGVGQSSDMSFFRSLAGQPAWIVRSVGHRRALTRIGPGRPDDANRPTSLRVSLLISAADWDATLRGDIGSLTGKGELWQWKGESALPALSASLVGPGAPDCPPAVAQKLASIISLIERAWLSRRPVLLRENNLTLDEFRLLGMLIPPAARSSYCGVYRSLTADLPASIICLAKQSPARTSIETYRTGQTVELSPYARALLKSGLANGSFPFEFIQSYRSFGMPPKPAASMKPNSAAPSFAMPSQVIVERMPRPLLVTLILGCILLPTVSGVCTWLFARGHHAKITAGHLEQFLRLPANELAPETRKDFANVCRAMASELPVRSHADIRQKVEAIDLQTPQAAHAGPKFRLVTFPVEAETEAWIRRTLFSQAQPATQDSQSTRIVKKVKDIAEAELTKGGHQVVLLPQSPEQITQWLKEILGSSGKPPRINLPDNQAGGLTQCIQAIVEERINDATSEKETQTARTIAMTVVNAANEALDRPALPGSDGAQLLESIVRAVDSKVKEYDPAMGVALAPDKLRVYKERSKPLVKRLAEYKNKLEKFEERNEFDEDLFSLLKDAIRDLEKKRPANREALIEAFNEWRPGKCSIERPADLQQAIESMSEPEPELTSRGN